MTQHFDDFDRSQPYESSSVGAAILVADDDDLLGELLSFKLEEAGYTVEIATDGESAVELAQTGDFALVVLDAMMPVLSGFDALRRLRQQYSPAELPIVMLTARSAKDDVVATLKAGATDYITKPFIPDELITRIDAILASSGGGNARGG